MKNIIELANFGLNKRCLIIGGGHSVNRFDFKNVPCDTYIICLNNHLTQMADMIFYYDKRLISYYDNHFISEDTSLVGYKSGRINYCSKKCSYYYTLEEMKLEKLNGKIVVLDSGFHALYYADKILNFEEIYLLGYDYKVNGKSYHFDEKESDPKRLECFVKASIGKVLPVYNEYKWHNKIYHCIEGSELGLFKTKYLN